MVQEIFNKEEQNQLQRTENDKECSTLPQYAVKTLSISAGSICNKVEMSCGRQPTDKWRWLEG